MGANRSQSALVGAKLVLKLLLWNQNTLHQDAFPFRLCVNTSAHLKDPFLGFWYLCDDAAELRSVLREGQQVADGAADGVNVV